MQGTRRIWPRLIRNLAMRWIQWNGALGFGGNGFQLFSFVVCRHLDTLSKLRTIWLPAPLVCPGTSSYYLMVTFLPDGRRGNPCRYICIGASLLGVCSIVCIEIGSARLSLLLVRTHTDLTVLF